MLPYQLYFILSLFMAVLLITKRNNNVEKTKQIRASETQKMRRGDACISYYRPWETLRIFAIIFNWPLADMQSVYPENSAKSSLEITQT